MSRELNPQLGLCKAQMLTALEVHRSWITNLMCLRQMQLQTDEGLLAADSAFCAELAKASDLNALLNSQLAFINRQLAMQHLIWQGVARIGARGPVVWAEQYQFAEKAWQHVFSEAAAAEPGSPAAMSGWEAWGDLVRSAMNAMSAISGEATRNVAQELAVVRRADVGQGNT